MGGSHVFRQWRMAVVALVLAQASGLSAASILYVAPAGQSTPAAPYTTTNTAANSIQVAINAAVDGDEIVILPGTYRLTTQILIERRANLIIRALDRARRATTIIDAQGNDRAFYMFTSPTVELRWLTIRNGVAKKEPHEDIYGGAVYIFDGGRILECVIENSRANFGGGVRIRGGGLVESSTVRSNSAAQSGGGVQVAYGGVIRDSELHNNTATSSGGGVYLFQGGVITNSVLHGNRANFGGGIRLWRDAQAVSTPLAAACTVFSNTAVRTASWAGEGGGAQTVGGTLVNLVAHDNEADGNGGGVAMRGGSIMNATIAHNSVLVSGVGGGIWTLGGTVQNSIISLNLGPDVFTADRNTNDGTVIYRNSLTSPAIYGNGNLFGLPDFVNADGRNYRLRGDSICIDTGLNSGAPAVDREGNPRPRRGRWAGPGASATGAALVDVGAFEYELLTAAIQGKVDYTPKSRITQTQITNAPLNIYLTAPGMAYNVTNVRHGVGPYVLTNMLPGVAWTIEAYLAISNSSSRVDGDGNPVGFYSGNPLTLSTGTTSNIDIVLTDLDTDGDGLWDYDELFGANLPFYGFVVTDPLKADTDGDGFGDKYEIYNDTNPTNSLSFLTKISGTTSYSGTLQNSGPVWISVVSPGMTTRSNKFSSLGSYSITNLPTKRPLTITAYRDGNTNSTPNTWEPTGAYAANPLTLTAAKTGVNIVLRDPSTDSDGDGLPNFEEKFIHGTRFENPQTDRDTDGDNMWDGWEVYFGLNPLSTNNAALDPDVDALTNLREYQASVTLLGETVLATNAAAGLNPNNPDTDGDGMPDGWELYFRLGGAPLNPLLNDAGADPDNDGHTNLQEYQASTNLLGFGFSPAAGLNPNNPDTDGDGMPDGWEAFFMPDLNPLVNDASEGVNSIDFDGLSNRDEFNLSTILLGPGFSPADGLDPTNPDTDGDGMMDGWEAQYMPSLSPLANDAAGDPDFDTIVNFDEYVMGTNPTKPDTDADGVNDDEELAVGTDPLDPLSYPVRIAGILSYSGVQTGIYHVVASQVPTGLVYSVIVTNAGPYAIRNAANATHYTVRAYLDSNGNATQDTWEATGVLSDTNGTPLVLFLTNQVSGADITLNDPMTDSDGDELTDYDEVYVHGTDPRDADSDNDGMPDGWEFQNGLNPLNPNDWNIDTDADGLKNSDEYFNRSDPKDPDSDNDGLNDGPEVLTYLTNPLVADTDGDGLNDYDEVIVFGTNPRNADTDGDSFTDTLELQVSTNPLDPLSFPATISGTVTYVGTQTGMIYVAATAGTNVFAATLQAPGSYSLTNVPTRKTYTLRAYMDTDGDQVRDTWEAHGAYSGSPVSLTNSLASADIMLVHPTTDTDGDTLTDYDEVLIHGTNPGNADTDGDLMPDGWEVQNGLDPLVNDAAGDPDGDILANLAEYQARTDPKNPDTDGDGMPDGWEAQYKPPLNPLVNDAAGDPDGDGLTNLQEYGFGTNPTRADTDGDGSRDSREAVVGSNPLDPLSYPIRMTGRVTYVGAQTGTVYLLAQSASGVVSNALTMSGTSVVYNVSNLVSRTDYTIHAYRDSAKNGQQDPWEPFGSYTNNPIVQPTNTLSGINVKMADPTTDTDGDGLTDYAEVFVHSTNPLNADTDSDGMPDGWEVQYTLNPRANDAAGDPDLDVLSNLAEYQAGTHPKNADTDGDGMKDGWEVQYGLNPLANDAGADPDTDGLTNVQEYGQGTQPNNPDTDGDLMPDGWEVQYKPPLNPLADDAAGDPDGDTLANLAEYQAGTNPKVADTDGDGRNDGFEVQWRSNPLNRASFPVTMTGTLLNATVAPQTGTVYIALNLESNANLFATFSIGSVTNGGPRLFTVQHVPTLSNYWISAFMDLSGDGNRDNWEPYGVAFNGTNSITPTNNFSAGLIPLVDSMLDSDGDGLRDFEEVTIYGTDPSKADTDADNFSDTEEVLVYNTDPLNASSFPAYIGGSVSYTNTQSGPLATVADDGTNAYSSSFGNYAAGPYSTATNLPTLTNYVVTVFIDGNTNGVLDLWEARGVPTGSPFLLMGNVTGADVVLQDPTTDTDGDGLSDYDERFVHSTDPTDPDTDGDGMPDGWEVHFGLVPTNAVDASVDIDLDGLTSLAEYQYSLSVLVAAFDPADGLDPTEDDTDGDTLLDGAEVLVHGTDPLIVDTDGDGMPDGWEQQYAPTLNPLVPDFGNDPDGDGLTNLQEYGLGTDPTDPDTDGDGLTDYEEAIVHGTDPLLPDTDADGFTDYDEVIGIGSDPTNLLDPVVVDDNAPADPEPDNPNNDYFNENGSLDFPFDSIQQAVNVAQPGFVVLVLDGEYKSTGNGNINPLGKAITIRSRNGYALTKILQDSGNGFILTSGEGSGTVIRGFTIRTSVEDLGSAGVLVAGGSPIIRECRFSDCGEAGVYVRGGGQPLIEDCLFEQNQGAIKIEESHPRIERCIMRYNEDDFGGGLWITGTTAVTSQPVIVNCLIAANQATGDGGSGGLGGGVYAGANTRAMFVNTTIADNTADVRGGGIYNAGDTKFWNGILWGNTAPVGPGFSLDKAFETSFSCMQESRIGSLKVITANPQFAGGGDYSLLSTSPCIDFGTFNNPYGGIAAPTNDIVLNRRPIYVSSPPGYDVGAYEYQAGGALFVQSPGGAPGQVVDAGLPQEIAWTYDGMVGTNLVLEYTYQFLTDPSLSWSLISSNVYRGNADGGRYSWVVPVTNTTRCYVRVSDATNAQVVGISTFEFAIDNGIQVYAPSGGETFYLGQTVDVEWASSPVTNTTATLGLSTNGGVSYLTTNAVHVSGGATNSFGWVLNSATYLTTNGRMRVSSGVMTNTSSGVLVIRGLEVTHPLSGTVQTGMPVNVRWTSLGAGAAVNIEYSDNGGGSYVTVSNGVANVNGTNLFAWTVPLGVTTNARLRISSPTDLNITGTSGLFEITHLGGNALNLAGDGIPDVWKIAQGLDPENLDGVSGAGDDPDGDGSCNQHEWLAGTDPLDGESVLGILSVEPVSSGPEPSLDAAGVVLRWRTVPGRLYVVETTDAPGGNWTNASGFLQATGNELDWTDTLPGRRRFYRIGTLFE